MRHEIPRESPNCISFWMPLVAAPFFGNTDAKTFYNTITKYLLYRPNRRGYQGLAQLKSIQANSTRIREERILNKNGHLLSMTNNWSRYNTYTNKGDHTALQTTQQNSHGKIDCTENEHSRVDIFFHLRAYYIFLFMDCNAISDMTVHPFLTLRVAETSVLWKT